MARKASAAKATGEKKRAKGKANAKASAKGGTATVDDDEDESLEDGIDEAAIDTDTESGETDTDAEAVDDGTDDDDADGEDDGEDDDTDAEAVDDGTDDDDADGGSTPAATAADDDGEATYSAGFAVIDYAPDEIQPTIVHDPKSARVVAMRRSIKKVGLINPIVIGSDAKIIAGNTRYAAMLALGYKKIPCRVAIDPESGEQVDSTKFAAQMQTIAENIARTELTPLEQGRLFIKLVDSGAVDDADALADYVGLKKTTVAKYIKLARDVTPEVAEALEKQLITSDAAVQLMKRASSPKDAARLLQDALTANAGKRVTYEDAKAATDKAGKGAKSKAGRKATKRPLSEEALNTEDSGISGMLLIDRESGSYTVKLVVDINFSGENFAKFNVANVLTKRVAKLDAKAVASELEVAREALNGE